MVSQPKAVTLVAVERIPEGPDYEHIPACLWPPDGCLVELDPLWNLTGRRVILDGGCCVTVNQMQNRGFWTCWHIKVDAGSLPDLRSLVRDVRQRITQWDEPGLAPTLKQLSPDEFILEVV